MPRKKNYEIIGMKLTYDVAERNAAWKAQFDPNLLDEFVLNDGKELACIAHLGYAPPEDMLPIIVLAADWAVGYFEKGGIREETGGWYDPLSRGLLLCLLMDDRSRIERICAWARPNKRLEYQGPLPDQIQLLYLVLANLFQQKQSKGFEKLRAKIAACRTKEVRLLSRALEAVVERDQEVFAKGIEACVKHHKTKPKPEPDAFFMEDWLPLHANTIYLVGLQLGLGRPDYPPQIAAYLMTPESVGFGK